ncbi:MAG: pirin family protein, partial [Bryobacterales bacterium]|nr:pirin family protein [Bryobacterales bacterium]
MPISKPLVVYWRRQRFSDWLHPMRVQTNQRTIAQILEGVKASDGAGVQLRRYIGATELQDLDPILLFDEFRTDGASDYVAGFPDHPHRGFETVTYMLDGRMRHHDNKGNSGLLETGGAQWMTAGAGLIHSEMPE